MAVALAVWVELALAVADVLVVVLPELGLLDGLVLVLVGFGVGVGVGVATSVGGLACGGVFGSLSST